MTTTDAIARAAAVPRTDPALRAELEDFLFHEARLLDHLDLDGWLSLLEPDAEYTVPMGPQDPTQPAGVSLVRDDRAHLEERVMRITSGRSYSQNPPSHTVHLVGNVTVTDQTGPAIEVGSNQVVVELRRGIQRTFAAECVHVLRRTESGLRIVSKRVVLLNRDEPMGDLTFLL